MRFLPPSIKREGLKVYLDRTMPRHNMFGYFIFFNMYKSKVNTSNLARAFNVDRKTMLHWIEVHKEELKEEHKN